MQILETHASSDKEAMELSKKYLNVESDQIEIKLHQKGVSGFLGLRDKKPNIYYVFAIAGKTPKEVVIKGVLSTILHKMGYLAKVSSIKEVGEKMLIELDSPKAGNIIGRQGKTLEALQIITSVLLEKYLGTRQKLILDIENYRSKRERSLEQMAERISRKVIETGRSRVTDPLNPYERRIIHMTLEDNDKLTTESLGQGNYKKVRIKLAPGVNGGLRERNDERNDERGLENNEDETPFDGEDSLGNTFPGGKPDADGNISDSENNEHQEVEVPNS